MRRRFEKVVVRVVFVGLGVERLAPGREGWRMARPLWAGM